MEKYFMKGSDDELKFGDMIELDLTKEMPGGGTHYHHLECKFMPELVSLLLEQDIIEVKEAEDEEERETLDFCGLAECDLIQNILKQHEDLELRIENLERKVCELTMLAQAAPSKSAPKKNGRKAC